MPDKKVIVIARVKAGQGMEEKVKEVLVSLIAPTRLEPGCINYDLHCSPDDSSQFMFHETWKTREDLDKHLQMPYIQTFLKKADHILAEPLDVSIWETVG